MLTNLISNAIKFSDSGSKLSLQIETCNTTQIDELRDDEMPGLGDFRAQLKAGSYQLSDQSLVYYKISVQDFGVGIPDHLIEKLFCDFGNLEEHRRRNPEGRGLGLTICKMIMDSFDGSI